jgi:hypothetical protein
MMFDFNFENVGYDIGKNNMQWETQVPIYIVSAEQVNSTDSFTKELNEITLGYFK